MNEQNMHVRNGIGAVRPFIYGRPDLLDFVRQVFGAVELERNKIDKGFHVQAQIGDSVGCYPRWSPHTWRRPTLRSMCTWTMWIQPMNARSPLAQALSINPLSDLFKSALLARKTLSEIFGTSRHTGVKSRAEISAQIFKLNFSGRTIEWDCRPCLSRRKGKTSTVPSQNLIRANEDAKGRRQRSRGG
jgi:hypothetical protein